MVATADKSAIGNRQSQIPTPGYADYSIMLTKVRSIFQLGTRNGWPQHPSRELAACRQAVREVMVIVEDQRRKPAASKLRAALDAWEAIPAELRARVWRGDWYDHVEGKIRDKADQPVTLTAAEARHCMGILRMLEILPADRRCADPAIAAALAEVNRQYELRHMFTAESLRKLLAAWLALPAARRRQILAGWSEPDASDYPYPAVASLETGCINTRFLILEGSGESDLFVTQDYEPSASNSPVHVRILEGSNRKEVVEALRGMLALVEGQFERLIAMSPATVFQATIEAQKEGHREASQAHTPESETGTEALSTAAKYHHAI